MQKGFSIVVHSVMNSMEPPVSAEMSQIANNLMITEDQECERFKGTVHPKINILSSFEMLINC